MLDMVLNAWVGMLLIAQEFYLPETEKYVKRVIAGYVGRYNWAGLLG
jgi:hypothetical protein